MAGRRTAAKAEAKRRAVLGTNTASVRQQAIIARVRVRAHATKSPRMYRGCAVCAVHIGQL